jgi:OOP family OmpA-OmpF porin
MKKLLTPVLLLLTITGRSQHHKADFVQAPTFGVHFVLSDFATASHIRKTSLRHTLREKKFARLGDMNPGLAINFQQGLNSNFDWSLMLAGSFLDYPRQDSGYFDQNKLLLEGDVSVRAKLWSIRHRVSPYVQAGIGVSKYDGYWGAFIPFGAGVQVNVLQDIYLLGNAQYRVPVTASTVTYHFFYSIGITGTILKKSERIAKSLPAPPTRPSDRDNDGIIDSLDACPDIPGLAMFQGCPDRDNDGIPDPQDSCVQIPGLARYHGCPVPDTDGDGLNDETDSCKYVPGIARYRGCPAPDRDRDGVPDDMDKCPDLAANTSSGCPEVQQAVQHQIAMAARNILFVTGSYRLLPASYGALDEVAQLLQQDTALQLSIEGHTDNMGTAKSNQLLSEQRANAVLQYLVKKGIAVSRLQAVGFGERRPVAENNTPKGRGNNRRVEMRVWYRSGGE